MRCPGKAVLARSLALALVISSAFAGRARSQPADGPVRKFVQEFYDWYAPLAVKNGDVPAFQVALKQRPYAFSPELAKALREDAEAQAKVTDDIVGIDWDPFLCGQDPAARYVVGRIAGKGRGYRVEVHAVRAGRKRATPDAIAEVAEKDGRWLFVNFSSPDGEDLLSALATLRKGREHHHD